MHASKQLHCIMGNTLGGLHVQVVHVVSTLMNYKKKKQSRNKHAVSSHFCNRSIPLDYRTTRTTWIWIITLLLFWCLCSVREFNLIVTSNPYEVCERSHHINALQIPNWSIFGVHRALTDSLSLKSKRDTPDSFFQRLAKASLRVHEKERVADISSSMRTVPRPLWPPKDTKVKSHHIEAQTLGLAARGFCCSAALTVSENETGSARGPLPDEEKTVNNSIEGNFVAMSISHWPILSAGSFFVEEEGI